MSVSPPDRRSLPDPALRNAQRCAETDDHHAATEQKRIVEHAEDRQRARSDNEGGRQNSNCPEFLHQLARHGHAEHRAYAVDADERASQARGRCRRRLGASGSSTSPLSSWRSPDKARSRPIMSRRGRGAENRMVSDCNSPRFVGARIGWVWPTSSIGSPPVEGSSRRVRRWMRATVPISA